MNASWENMGFGSYPVTVIPHYIHVLADSTELAMKLWLPWKSTDKSDQQKKCDDELLYDGQQKYPAILEYLPYRKSDWTASRDHARHSWFCSHGYVCVRVDQRGSGDSTGHYYDEYEVQELKDCSDVIEWLSKAQWSNGRVGMYGKSWGGFNGLQVAYLKPKALKTVISLYSTDNRFTDDIHYTGNCVIGSGMLAWSSTMLAWNARPPTPKYCISIDDFKRRWKDRLEQTTSCWAKIWLEHQYYDEYWKHGSICENYANVQCPVLVIGGLIDSYTNAAFRMAAKLNYQSKAVIGPWDHDWPDVATVGPTVDYLTICLNWWDYHLKSKEVAKDDVSRWSPLQIYVRQPYQPYQKPSCPFDGMWYNVPKWSEMFQQFQTDAENQSCLKTFLFCTNQVLGENGSDTFLTTTPVELPKPHLFQGLFCGDWISWGILTMAESQVVPNRFSLCWTSKPLSESLTICGFTKLVICLESSKTGQYAIAARLCHLWPNDESTLITYGVCNLNYSDDGRKPKTQVLNANEARNFSFNLNATTYIIPAGHRICLAVAPTLFPILYPMPKSEGSLKLYPDKCKCIMQILPENFRKEHKGFAKPRPLLQLPKQTINEPSTNKKVEFELNSNKVKLTKFDDSGRLLYPILGLEYSEICKETYETNFEADYCDIVITNSIDMKFKKDSTFPEVDTKVETVSSMQADEEEFHLQNEVTVFLNGENLFQKSWTDDIPRNFV